MVCTAAEVLTLFDCPSLADGVYVGSWILSEVLRLSSTVNYIWVPRTDHPHWAYHSDCALPCRLHPTVLVRLILFPLPYHSITIFGTHVYIHIRDAMTMPPSTVQIELKANTAVVHRKTSPRIMENQKAKQIACTTDMM